MTKVSRESLQQRKTLFEALTGASGVQISGSSTDVRGMLGAVYGTTRKGQRTIDTREAARRIGVSQRTVQRWLQGQNHPSQEHLKKLQNKSRQAVTTKRGRERAVRRATAGINATARQKGAKITVGGTQGPFGGTARGQGKAEDTDTARPRISSVNLDPAEYEELLAAYANGGDAAAAKYLQTLWSEKYIDGWTFHTIEQVNLTEYSSFTDPRAR